MIYSVEFSQVPNATLFKVFDIIRRCALGLPDEFLRVEVKDMGARMHFVKVDSDMPHLIMAIEERVNNFLKNETKDEHDFV